MPNGKPGDHPLTDILTHRLEVYGQEVDELIRKIGDLCSARELDDWWSKEVGWTNDRAIILTKARARYEALLARAKTSGWET